MIIIADGEVDRSHAAVSQETEQTIGPDPAAGHVSCGRSSDVSQDAVGRKEGAIDERSFRDVAGEQGVQFSSQRFVAVARFAKEPLAFLGWKLDGLQEETFDLIPPVRPHDASGRFVSKFEGRGR